MAGTAGSRTLARGLALLRALGGHPDGVTVAKLASDVDLDRAVVYRLLDTLARNDFVVRDDATKLFSLGTALVELGARAAESLTIRRVALPVMHVLMERCGEAVCLTVRQGEDAVVVARVQPAGMFVSVAYDVGFRHALGRGAHGRALAGSDGVVVSQDELEQGTSGIAAAVADGSGATVAALGVVAPTPRLRDPMTLADLVTEAVQQVSRALATPA